MSSRGPRRSLGGSLPDNVSRRDFCNGVLLGAGASLLDGAAAATPGRGVDDPIATAWNGPGGVGEYGDSNGSTWRTVEAGHRLRDGVPAGAQIAGDDETYDLIIVGGGFTGLGALRAFRLARPAGRCLLLDNQEIFGGYAKANEFDVDGHRIAGAQASLNFVLPSGPQDRPAALWKELGLPTDPAFAEREDGERGPKFAASSSGPLYMGEQSATTGYFFGATGWRTDIWKDDLSRAPWPDEMKVALLALRERRRRGPPEAAEAARLDSMTFAEFATRELKATPEALKFITQGMCVTGPQISAYGARALPGLERFAEGSEAAVRGERFMSFPTGNTVLARALLRGALPEAFTGGTPMTGFGRLVASALDRPGAAARVRLRSTVMRVGNRPDGRVEVIYERHDRLHSALADGVVLATGAWVARHLVADLPGRHRSAFGRYLYSPILMASVALRNWRFMDRLGVSAARWFDGTGFYANIRKPMRARGGRAAPFHPDKPIVMTLYAPFPRAELPLEAQGPSARAELLATSYADYERAIVGQLEQMFAVGGFDARRDIAGIVLNRWGHAFVTPPPGFFFGEKGTVAPVDIVGEPVGRIAFGQTGLEDWAGAVMAGERAVGQLLT